jgi:hypothetical protein
VVQSVLKAGAAIDGDGFSGCARDHVDQLSHCDVPPGSF